MRRPAIRLVLGVLGPVRLTLIGRAVRAIAMSGTPASNPVQPTTVLPARLYRWHRHHPRVHIGSAGSDTQSDLGTLNPAGVPTVLIERCLLYTSPSPRDGLLSRMPS